MACAQTNVASADTAQPATSEPAAVQPASSSQGTSQQPSGASKRLFFAMPNFLTVENAGEVAPLTVGEKFKMTAQGSFDPFTMFWYAAEAGVSQLKNSDSAYGQGAEGYAKRFGEHFADGTIENFMTKAIFPSMLHQDPRYFQLGKGGFGHRTWYAVSRVFVTRGDNGNAQFNASEMLGAASAAGISAYTYHPRDDRSVAQAGSVMGTQVAYDALSFWLKEFWPDIRGKLHKSKSGSDSQAGEKPTE